MKKIITKFLLLLFFSVPCFVKAQIEINKSHINNEGKSATPKFIENISFTPSNDLLPPASSPNKFRPGKEASASTISSVDDIENISLVQVKYAMMLDVNVESVKNKSLYEFIENWLGTRYRMGGNAKSGIDCSAFTDSLLSAVYKLVLPRTAKEQYNKCEHIYKEKLLEGDLVFFNTRGGVSHVGVYLANGRFVHSSVSEGVIISNLADKYFSHRFIGAGRMQNN